MKKYNMPNLGKFQEVGNFHQKNQFIITFEKWKILQSYDSIIVAVKWDDIFIGQNWDYSKTTWKYRNMFLWEDKKETYENIQNWTYKMLDV